MSALLETALGYARQGLVISPLQPGMKTPFGEHPCTAPPHFHGKDDATRDVQIVEAWWTTHPTANIALATGRGVDVLDVDGPEGEASLAALCARRWPLPETCEVRTGRADGGRHLYFLSGGWPCTASKLGPHLDTKGIGGYVVLPPSVHPTGAIYTWTNSSPCAPAPAWLTQLLLRREEIRPVVPRRPLRAPSRYGAAALEDAVRTVCTAPETTRNVTLNAEAFGIGQLVVAGVLDEGHAEDELVGAAVEAGLPEHEARRTTRSAFKGGAAKPRDVGSASS